MSERLYSDIVPLLSNGDPKIRRYAVEELIRNLERLDRSSVVSLFTNAADDDDEDVAKAAKYGMSVLFQRRRSRSPTLMGTEQMAKTIAKLPKDFNLPDLRSAAQDVLRESLKLLATTALDEASGELGEYAVALLGRFAFHESLETLYRATLMKGREEAAVRAIANFEDEDVLFLMKKFLKRFEDERIRAQILRALSNLTFPEVLDILEQHAASPGPVVRAATAQSLGKWNDERAETILLRLLQDASPEVVGRALDSLAILGRPTSGAAVAALCGPDHDKKLRSRATTALGFLRAPDTVPVLYRLLEDGDHRVVANAVDALRCFDLPRDEVVRHVGPLLNHPNNRAKGNAIVSMAAVEEGRAMGVLHRLLQSPVRAERASSAWVVGEVRSVDSVKWVVSLLNTELDAGVLSAALNALEKLDRPETRTSLNRLFKHPNASIRAQAIRVYSKLADSSAMRQLEELLRGENVQTVRSAIVAAMGNVCDSGNFMAVTRLLQDPNERVVANAIEALDRMGSLEVTPFISGFTSHANNRIRANTILALWKLGDLKVARDLHDMLTGRDDAVKRSALHALKQVANFLQAPLLLERPLLLSALKDRHRQRARSGGVPITEVSRQYQELFRMEEQFEGTKVTEDTGVGRLLAERAAGDPESLRVALTDFLGVKPRDPVGLFLCRRLPAPPEGLPLPGVEELRGLWEKDAFVPGLLELLDQSKEQKDLRAFLADYLALFSAQSQLYGALLERARNLLSAGDEAAVQRVVKFLVERLPLQPRLHRDVGDLAFSIRDPDLAYDHYLRAFLQDERDLETALKLCSSALRRGDLPLAARLIEILQRSPEADAETIEKAGRFQELLETERAKKAAPAGTSGEGRS